MVNIKPFQGYRYNTEKVRMENAFSPPYDVINPAMQEELYKKSAYNIVRIILGKDEKDDNETENKYTRAASFFRSWLKSGHIKQDDKPHMYVYSQEFLVGGKKMERTGLITTTELEALGKNILPHEFTLSGPKVGRKILLEKTEANFGQIFSIYLDKKMVVESILENEKNKAAEFDVADFEGIRHKLWIIKDETAIKKIIEIMRDKKIFIADGHHRYETSLEYSKEHPDNEKAKYIMMTLVNIMNKGLVILPTHRLVKDISVDAAKLIDGLKRNFSIEIFESGKDNGKEAREKMFKGMKTNESKHAFGMYLGGNRYSVLTLTDEKVMDQKAKGHAKPWRRLDVSILHTLILDGLLGIDTNKPEKQQYIEYMKDTKDAVDECVEKVKSCACKVVFFMNPTKIDEVVDVAESGERMPQKSTFFYPKVYTGLVMYRFGEK